MTTETLAATQTLNALVTDRTDFNSRLAVFRVAPEDWSLPDFEPGQFAVLGLPAVSECCESSECKRFDEDKLIKRAYSIASAPGSDDGLEFYVQLVGTGALTPRLFALKAGNRIWPSPRISGKFTLKDVPEDSSVVLVSTGTGLAPYISMVRHELRRGSRRQIAVLHGARHAADLGYSLELESLENSFANFAYLPAVSRPHERSPDWQGFTGYVQDLWARRVLDERWKTTLSAENTQVFLCGNPRMIEAFEKLLTGEGFRRHSTSAPGQVHVESYG